MLTLAEANALIDQHLGASSRAQHSRFVGYVMRRIAEMVGGAADIWELTGLCHDLDFETVAGDWSQHGLLAASWLEGDLPPDALEAIRSHDHRAGVHATTAIAHALKLADALVVIVDELGAAQTAAILAEADAGQQLSRRCVTRPWLVDLLARNAKTLGLPLPALANVFAAAPPAR